MCYFAACESDMSAQNYLRALLNGYGSGKKREELQRLLKAFPVHENGGSYPLHGGYGGNVHFEREENKPDRNKRLLLMFLDEQFDNVLKKGLNESQALGWTGTFMKQELPCFCYIFMKGSGVVRE